MILSYKPPISLHVQMQCMWHVVPDTDSCILVVKNTFFNKLYAAARLWWPHSSQRFWFWFWFWFWCHTRYGTASLVPRLLLPPVFDHLLYAKMEEQGLGDLVTCIMSDRQRVDVMGSGAQLLLLTNFALIGYWTTNYIYTVFKMLQSQVFEQDIESFHFKSTLTLTGLAKTRFSHSVYWDIHGNRHSGFLRWFGME